MKRIILFSAVISMLIACSLPNSKKNEKNEKKAKPAVITQEVRLTNENLDAIYRQYLGISAALISEDSLLVMENAIAFEFALRQTKSFEKLDNDVQKLTNCQTISQQRANFTSLSEQMISLIKQYGVKQGKVYIAHCPMAKNDEGANWLTNKKEVRNPYYGDEMLDCGSITETLTVK